jgi:hypothetical protein
VSNVYRRRSSGAWVRSVRSTPARDIDIGGAFKAVKDLVRIAEEI